MNSDPYREKIDAVLRAVTITHGNYTIRFNASPRGWLYVTCDNGKGHVNQSAYNTLSEHGALLQEALFILPKYLEEIEHDCDGEKGTEQLNGLGGNE